MIDHFRLSDNAGRAYDCFEMQHNGNLKAFRDFYVNTDVYKRQGYEVVAINDLTSPKMLAHLLKYDSSQGKYEHARCV